MTQQLAGPRNARSAQDMDWLGVDDVMERLSMPDGINPHALDVGPTAKIEATRDGAVNVRFNRDRNQTFTIESKEAMKSVAELVGLPSTVLKGYPSEFGTPLLSHGLRKKDGVVVISDEENRIVSVEDRDKRHPIMPAEQVVENLFMQWPELKFQDAQMSKTGFQSDILAITHDDEKRLEDWLQPGLHEFLPQGGDPFRAGVRISTNPMGLAEPVIEPYLLRLVCRNGAIHAEYMHNEWGRGYGEGDELWQWFRDGLQSSNVAIDGILSGYAGMIDQAIPQDGRAAAVEGYIRQARLGGDEARAMRDQAMNEPVRTMYDLFNLATANATHGNNNTLQDMIGRQRRATANTANAEAHARYCPT